MNALIGDIGNTITKICLIEIKTFKVKKIICFNSSKISSTNFLRKNLFFAHETNFEFSFKDELSSPPNNSEVEA